ncbi:MULTISPECIES: DUF2501 domain-containing protein [Dyella]|uniref:DUF2501 domain-containing protein n=2 Tax=Dyella TaxID=231454 RepID=A0A4R0YZ72_9GAMM|nr:MULTISPECIES: DUF2501 domain-containing protein [Dyella]TBR39699.1 DUF2501 domain-containing protein [Dyella terrae]TCI12719.1 DUF2501 domain-containing protein [Dyella soli]
MNMRTLSTSCLALALAAAATSTTAQDLGKLGSMIPGGGSMTSGSMGNVAGLLQYCVKNNFLGGDSGAAGVKDQLLGKLGTGTGTESKASSNSSNPSDMMNSMLGSKHKTGSTTSSDPTSDAGYLSGAKGILQGSNGKSVDLNTLGGGSSDLKSELTHKACDTVLKQGKSLIGM